MKPSPVLSPAQHELGVLAVDVLLHQLQQQRPHDVGVVLQLAVQRHRQERGKVHLGPGVEVVAALQRADELQEDESEDVMAVGGERRLVFHFPTPPTTNNFVRGAKRDLLSFFPGPPHLKK